MEDAVKISEITTNDDPLTKEELNASDIIYDPDYTI